MLCVAFALALLLEVYSFFVFRLEHRNEVLLHNNGSDFRADIQAQFSELLFLAHEMFELSAVDALLDRFSGYFTEPLPG